MFDSDAQDKKKRQKNNIKNIKEHHAEYSMNMKDAAENVMWVELKLQKVAKSFDITQLGTGWHQIQKEAKTTTKISV